MNKADVLQKMKTQYDPYEKKSAINPTVPLKTWDDSGPVMRLALYLQEQASEDGFRICIEDSSFILSFDVPIDAREKRMQKALQVEQLLIAAVPDLRYLLTHNLIHTVAGPSQGRVEVRFPEPRQIAGGEDF